MNASRPRWSGSGQSSPGRDKARLRPLAWALALALLTLAPWIPGCSDDDGAAQDAEPQDAWLDAGSGRDADAAPDGSTDGGLVTVQHDFCGQPIYRFPTPNYSSTHGWSAVGRDWLVLTWGNDEHKKYPLIFLDPDTCTEYRPLPDMRFAGNIVGELDDSLEATGNIYAVNLLLLGVVDDQGNLLPGDPVIDSLPGQ